MTATESTIAKRQVKSAFARKHKWRDSINIHRDSTPSGCDETERECEHCHLVKLTVHPPFGFPFRMWRTKGGVRFPDMPQVPLCED
jgi:hypothetical protein